MVSQMEQTMFPSLTLANTLAALDLLYSTQGSIPRDSQHPGIHMMLLHQVVNECLIGCSLWLWLLDLFHRHGFVWQFAPGHPPIYGIIFIICIDGWILLLKLVLLHAFQSSYGQERVLNQHCAIRAVDIMLQN